MRLTTQDKVGVTLLLATFVAVVLHDLPSDHRASHRSPVADAGGAVTSALDADVVVFYDVNVVPMDRDGVVRHQVVVVQDGFVTRIGDVGVVAPPKGARIVEGHGTRFLAPGLTDAHVHLGDDPEELLPLFLANGVTTVFNLEGDGDHLELRDRVLRGEIVGPTIYTAGPFVDDASVRSPTDARREIRRQKRRGYDFVKLHGDLTEDAFEALVRTGRDEGVPVVGHAPRNLPFSEVLENGQAGISHAEELIYTEFVTLETHELGRVASRMADAGTWLTPGISNFQNTATLWGAPAGLAARLDRPEAAYLPPSLRRSWSASRELTGKDPRTRPRIEQMLAFHEPLVRTFHEAGVPILAGTDAGLPGMVPGFSLHDEVAALHHVGLSRYDALAAATRNAGVFAREHVDGTAVFGTIRVSARADLVLLDTDPRQDLDALRRPAGVMVRGRWYDRTALDRLLERPAGR